jgi:hypothetical protein
MTAFTEHPGPKDLLVTHRASWGILPHTPVFSLRSARCHWYSSITPLTEHPGPKNMSAKHRTSFGPVQLVNISVQSSRSTTYSAPREARKRGSGEGSPRKHDDLLTGLSDLDAQSSGITHFLHSFIQPNGTDNMF